MRSERRPSVLIVEDERIVAKDLQLTLRLMGYDAFAIASSADEALARATERCPDIVLMDIRIKGQPDGIEAAALLRERFNVPIVYLTAHADEATIHRAKQVEPHGYLVKPVKAGELRSAIEISLYRREMEKRLRERERWLSTTLRSVADAVVTVDLSGNVTFMNPVAEQLTGVKADAVIGRPAREIVQLIDAQHSLSPLDMALEQGQTIHIHEATLASNCATKRIISDSAAPVIDAGQTLGAVMVFHDITEQKLLQRQLEFADRLASLGTMAAGVAHEVNSPLAVIVANASFIHDALKQTLEELEASKTPSTASLERLRKALAAQLEVQESARRITSIVADLKAFSRPSPTAGTATDVARVVDWALRTTAQEFRHRARVTRHVSAVPLVAIDETRLGQVLVNLLINAAHAISPGNAQHNEVSVSVRPGPADDVTIEVRDSGCGMPKEVLQRIFEPFFTTKPCGVGTGLGLSVCYGIIAAAGGSLQAESALDHGSVFRVVLPSSSKSVRDENPPDTTTLPAAASRSRVLVVDDQDMMLSAIERILEGEHEVVCVDSARKALQLMDEGQHFDVILSDLMMPDMTGMDFYEKLLETYPDNAPRVIFLSGGAVTARAAEFLASTPNARLEKPFKVSELRAMVQQVSASFHTALSARTPSTSASGESG